MSDAEQDLRNEISRIKKHLRVTKVVCTRSVKGRNGDHYVGFSAAWDTIQDDAGGGGDLISVQDGDEDLGVHSSGMSLKEARLAALLLGMQADISATDHAMAGQSISAEERGASVKAIRANYVSLMLETKKIRPQNDEDRG